VGVIRNDPPTKIGRALGVLEVVVGALMMIAGLIGLVALIASSSKPELFVLVGVSTFVFLVGGLIFFWNGRNRLKEIKNYQNSPHDIIL
jgi:hypothetical protein